MQHISSLYLAVLSISLPMMMAISFENRTVEVGLSGVANDSSVFADYDNDGDPDLFAGGLWRNDGGVFTWVSSPLSGRGLFADFDNDGLLDFYSFAGSPMVYMQDLSEADGWRAASYLPSPPMTISQGAAIADFNGDSFLDVYVGGYEANLHDYQKDGMWFGNGDGTFNLVWTEPYDPWGWNLPARGITACDFDEDGDVDIYVSNYRLERNYLWVNDGNGNLTDYADSYNVDGIPDYYINSYGHTIGSSWGDMNNDGHFDLFVGNFSHSWDATQDLPFFMGNDIFSSGSFTDYSATAGLAWQESYASPNLVDVDNDASIDLFFTTVYAGDYPVLYQNDGGFAFHDVTAASGLSYVTETYQNAWADIDLDGDQDLMAGGNLYLNTTEGGNWLRVKLYGNGFTSNHDAIGAQVRIASISGTVSRQVESGTGEGNSNELVLHFGLGADPGPFNLDIRWPDGQIQSEENVDPNQAIEIDQCIDLDEDGFYGLGCSSGDDCDDGNATIHPTADELCDGVDNNCDGLVDDDSAIDIDAWYADADEDGYGDASSSTASCSAPMGYTADATDCDDANYAINPDANEICDTIDNNCDTRIDDDDPAVDVSTYSTWYADNDADGYGDLTTTIAQCESPSGHVADNTDCDDASPDVNPSVNEICDGIDNNCDGLTDSDDPMIDVSTYTTWYADSDGDGYGNPDETVAQCDALKGYTIDSSDCDDTNAAVNPSAIEQCDGIDNNCNGLTDDDDPDVDTTTYSAWYADTDGDQFGDLNALVSSCAPPEGYVADATDCDDMSNEIFPDAIEICDGQDQDCDGQVDENVCEPEAEPAPELELDPVDSEECGCSSSGGMAGWPILVTLLPWLRRRRT
jgi:uncharacterized protein (TIGR03382 family)